MEKLKVLILILVVFVIFNKNSYGKPPSELEVLYIKAVIKNLKEMLLEKGIQLKNIKEIRWVKYKAKGEAMGFSFLIYYTPVDSVKGYLQFFKDREELNRNYSIFTMTYEYTAIKYKTFILYWENKDNGAIKPYIIKKILKKAIDKVYSYKR